MRGMRGPATTSSVGIGLEPWDRLLRLRPLFCSSGVPLLRWERRLRRRKRVVRLASLVLPDLGLFRLALT